MTRSFQRSLAWIGLVAFSACSGDSPDSPSQSPDAVGSLMITAASSGLDGPSSYKVGVDQGAPVDIFPNVARSIGHLSAGSHLVAVTGIPSNCSLRGGNPRTVAVFVGIATAVDFSLVCVSVTGTIEVSVTTSGLGPLTYDVLVDDVVRTVVPATGMSSLTGVQPGEHAVALNVLAAGCTVLGSNPRTVTVTAGTAFRDTARTSFDAFCAGPRGLASVRIVLVRDVSGKSYLYAMSGDGSNLRELTEGSAPSVSPDGTKIAFDRDDGIYVMKADQSDVRRVATEGQGATWSPDGARLAYAGTGADRAIYVVAADGQGSPVRLSGPTTVDSDFQPAWSPDGRQVAFTRWEGEEFSTVWIVNADGTGQTRIGRMAGNVTWAAWSPVWSPGNLVAIASPEGTGAGGLNAPFHAAIFVMGRDGSSVHRLAEIPTGSYLASLDDWSPDGNWISFTMGSGDGHRNVYLVGGDGVLVRLTDDGESSAAAFVRGPMP